MTLKSGNIKTVIVLFFATLTIVAFQNCSNVNFSKDQNSSALKGTSIDSDDSIIDPGIADVPRNDDEVDNVVEEEKEEIASTLVECELMSASQKVIFDQVLKVGSNASASRVCMSEYSCLKLINSYAAKRECQLSQGESSLQDSESQCTKIFPGSKGTCHKAQVISDEKVAEVLELMAKAQ